MKNRSIVPLAVILMITVGNYVRNISNSSIRVVEFVSIFAIGALSTVLLVQVIKAFKDKS